jgi:excisionase family DNA binding protein
MNTNAERSTASNPLPDLWPTDYTARFLHCSLGTLLKMAQAGEIPACKIGRGWVFDPAKVRAWLDAKMNGEK